MYSYSTAGLALTKRFEGFRATAYRDCAGVLTIGYGHTGPDVRPGMTVTEPQAEDLLRADMALAIAEVNRAVEVPLSQGQFDALCDFAYNAGRGSLLTSTLLEKVNLRDFNGAAAQFGRWVDAGGRVVPGLVARRKAEAEMFSGVAA